MSKQKVDDQVSALTGEPETEVNGLKDEEDEKEEEKGENRFGHVSIYVSNIGPGAQDDELTRHFSDLNGFVISKIIKQASKNPEQEAEKPKYGFVEFDCLKNAQDAIKRKCGTMVGGNVVNLELSKNKQTISKFSKNKDEHFEESHTIIVKNLPFQATKKELADLFKYYANVKTVRVPRSAGNTHRGFGFVEFMSKNDAKIAIQNLENVHLYGRRLVLQYVQNSN